MSSGGSLRCRSRPASKKPSTISAPISQEGEIRLALNGWFLRAPATGTGQYLRQLAGALAPLFRETGGDLALVAPLPDPTANEPLCIARPRLGGNPGKVEFEQYRFPHAAARQRFDVAHVPHFGPPLFSTVPVVVTIHDLIPLVLPAYRGSLAVRAYTALAAQSARRARMIIADSEASRRDILARLRVAPERVRVVYLAAGPRYHPADRVEIARVRARYHLPERFVLYLGGFDVRKNVRLLVDAFESLPDQRVGWKLVLAGQIPEPASDFFPDPRPGASSAVLCIGHVAEEDKPGLYSAAGLFAYPSLYEGFGLPPLEAIACGTPVICSDSSSLPEIVGEAGTLIGPSNGQAWAAALRALIRDEAARSELSGRGIERAAKFSWERTAKETLEVYQAASI